LRLGLSPQAGAHLGNLAVHVLKRRGATLPQPILIDVGAAGARGLTQFPATAPRLTSGTQ
jgi:hypothetical protein